MDGSFPQKAEIARDRPVEPARLGRAVYDPARRVVALDGAETTLEPRLADVLDALLQADRPVSRSDLLDAAWGQGEGSDEALTQVISKLRKALGDDARPFAVIETAPKFGYAIGAAARSIPEGDSNDEKLQAPPPADESPSPSGWWSRLATAFRRRRQFLAGLGVGFAAALLIIGWPKQVTAEIEIVCNGDADDACAEARASAERSMPNGASSTNSNKRAAGVSAS